MFAIIDEKEELFLRERARHMIRGCRTARELQPHSCGHGGWDKR
jgi:hypothetical protein